MHIAEGVLPGPVLITGAALSAAGVAVGIRRLDYDDLPRAGLLTAAFYVVSLIHLEFYGVSIHLVLNGLLGLLLGWVAFPAILLGLLLQSVFFQEGGLTALGVNTFVMAAPAVVAGFVFRPLIRSGRRAMLLWGGFACAFLVVLASGVLAGLAVMSVGEPLHKIGYAVMVYHLPLAVLEGVITAFCLSFLHKVRPEVLAGPVSEASP
ncbi:cobalt transporter CbiM [bacterium]|nr:cobalt transporter CbiM [bacterium]